MKWLTELILRWFCAVRLPSLGSSPGGCPCSPSRSLIELSFPLPLLTSRFCAEVLPRVQLSLAEKNKTFQHNGPKTQFQIINLQFARHYRHHIKWKPELNIPGLFSGQPLWFHAALVNKLETCAWLSSGALEVWRLRLSVSVIIIIIIIIIMWGWCSLGSADVSVRKNLSHKELNSIKASQSKNSLHCQQIPLLPSELITKPRLFIKVTSV